MHTENEEPHNVVTTPATRRVSQCVTVTFSFARSEMTCFGTIQNELTCALSWARVPHDSRIAKRSSGLRQRAALIFIDRFKSETGLVAKIPVFQPVIAITRCPVRICKTLLLDPDIIDKHVQCTQTVLSRTCGHRIAAQRREWLRSNCCVHTCDTFQTCLCMAASPCRFLYLSPCISALACAALFPFFCAICLAFELALDLPVVPSGSNTM